jgi:cytochrome c peroxidase
MHISGFKFFFFRNLVLNSNNAVERKKISCHSCVGQDRSIAAAIKQYQGVLKETGKRKTPTAQTKVNKVVQGESIGL